MTPLFLFHWGAAIPRELGHLAGTPGDTSYKVTALTASTVTERRAWNQLAVPALCSPVGEALHLSSDTCNSSRMTYSHLHLQRKNLRQRGVHLAWAPAAGSDSSPHGPWHQGSFFCCFRLGVEGGAGETVSLWTCHIRLSPLLHMVHLILDKHDLRRGWQEEGRTSGCTHPHPVV